MTTPVSFEIAKLLKEKGFNDVTYKSYRISINPERPLPTEPITDENTFFPNVKESYSAPTIAEVVMWLYEKHGIWIEVIETDLFNKFFFQIKRKDNTRLKNGDYNSPTEAYEAAIDYTLKNLI